MTAQRPGPAIPRHPLDLAGRQLMVTTAPRTATTLEFFPLPTVNSLLTVNGVAANLPGTRLIRALTWSIRLSYPVSWCHAGS